MNHFETAEKFLSPRPIALAIQKYDFPSFAQANNLSLLASAISNPDFFFIINRQTAQNHQIYLWFEWLHQLAHQNICS